jgi:hypothetical protein
MAREGAPLPPPSATSGEPQGRARSVIVASPQTEVAGGHSENGDEQRDEPERPENIFGHCFLLGPALTKPCRRQRTLSAAKCHAFSEPQGASRKTYPLCRKDGWGPLARQE